MGSQRVSKIMPLFPFCRGVQTIASSPVNDPDRFPIQDHETLELQQSLLSKRQRANSFVLGDLLGGSDNTLHYIRLPYKFELALRSCNRPFHVLMYSFGQWISWKVFP